LGQPLYRRFLISRSRNKEHLIKKILYSTRKQLPSVAAGC
jgi:hypothetical protein